jgi:site-specific recombinase XerD
MTTWLGDYLAFLEHSERSPATVRSYQSDLAGLASWYQDATGEAFDPSLLTPTDLRHYKRTLIDRGGLKPTTVNRKLASLRGFLKWAAEAGHIQTPLALKVPKFEPEQRPGPRWLDRREQSALLRRVERGGQARDIAIVKLLLNTGLRVQELCALTWKDVTVSERKGTLTVRRGKGSKRREIPLNKDAREALESAGYGLHAGSEEAIFRGQRGPLTPRGVQTLLARYGPTDGPSLSPHALRHTFCKNLVDAGVGLEKVAALAGHEDLETTRRYCAPSLKDLEKAVDLIGEAE